MGSCVPGDRAGTGDVTDGRHPADPCFGEQEAEATFQEVLADAWQGHPTP